MNETNESEYTFPTQNLKRIELYSCLLPTVIVACGSFSPITHSHLRMFEMARDYLRTLEKYQIIGGYLSPVSDAYNKVGLENHIHRVKMCELATGTDSSNTVELKKFDLRNSDLKCNADKWLMVDSWESRQPETQRTAVVLEHFEKQLLETMGRKVHVIFLAGGDLIESFGVKGLWDTDDLHHILNNYECCIVERNGTDLDNLLFNSDILYQYKKNIHVIKQPIQNDISSSKIRLMIKREKSVKYLLPDSVNKYIRDNNLFKK